MPRAAAARATATSPSGCTACTPVGEISTGSEICCPITVVVRSRCGGSAADVRGEAELAERGDVVGERQPASEPATSAEYTDFGQAPLGPPLGHRHRLEPAAGISVTAQADPSGLSSHARARRAALGHVDRAAAGPDRSPARRPAARSPCPSTHSGSGPSSGSPVKNLAAMQPPRHVSNSPQLAHAPAVCGSRSSANSSDSRQTSAKPPGVAHVAGEELVVDRERAGVHVADRVDQAHDAARRRTGSARAAARRTPPGGRTSRRSGRSSPCASSHSYSSRCCAAVGCSSSHTSAPRPDGPQPREPQLRAVAVRERLELVELRRRSRG